MRKVVLAGVLASALAVMRPAPARAQGFQPDPRLLDSLAAMVAFDARLWVGGQKSELRFDDLPRPLHALTAAALAGRYRLNAKAADAEFRNTLLVVEGRVSMVHPTEPPTIGLLTNQPLVDVAAHAARDAVLPRLMTGDRVRLLCMGDGVVDGAPDLAACGPADGFEAAERESARHLLTDWFAGGPPPLDPDGRSAAAKLFRVYAMLTLAPPDLPCRAEPTPPCWDRLLAGIDPGDGIQREAIRRLREQAEGDGVRFTTSPSP